MEKKNIAQNSFRLMVAISCVVGFIFQVVDISDRHFKYQTRTLLKLDTLYEIHLPSVSACIQKNMMLNYTKVYSVYPNRSGITHWKDGIDWDAYYRDTKDWRMKTWFNFTPKSEDILDRCGMRLPNDLAFWNYPPNECNKMGKMFKYFDREYVCYRYEFNISQSVGVVQSTLTPGYNGMLYRIALQKKYVSNYEYVSISVHGHDSSYLYDTVYGSVHKVNGKNQQFKFDAYYQEVEQVRMRIPFDTQCVDIPDNFRTGAEYQLEYLNQQSMKILNKVTPFVPTYDENLNQTLFSDLDIRNKSYSDFFFRVATSRKLLIECKLKYFITKTVPSKYHIFSIYVHWPQDKKILVIYVPLSETIDYIIYIGSCVGMWLGLSALSVIDGAKYISKSLKRKDPDEDFNPKRMKETVQYLMVRNRILENNVKYLRQRSILKSK